MLGSLVLMWPPGSFSQASVSVIWIRSWTALSSAISLSMEYSSGSFRRSSVASLSVVGTGAGMDSVMTRKCFSWVGVEPPWCLQRPAPTWPVPAPAAARSSRPSDGRERCSACLLVSLADQPCLEGPAATASYKSSGVLHNSGLPVQFPRASWCVWWAVEGRPMPSSVQQPHILNRNRASGT
jgi:hypothetical protein